MNPYELFININELPDVLSKEETHLLLVQIKSGNVEAKNKLIEHNIRLVLRQVLNKYKRVKYDKKEMVCIGIIGLINAANTFDIDKNFQFSTYATKCIDNEINHLLYHLNKDTVLDSMEKVICFHSDGDDLKLGDFLSDDIDIEEQYIEKETLDLINEIISELPENKRKMIQMYYGLGEYKGTEYKQREIAEELGMERSNMAHIMSNTLKEIKYQLETRRIKNIQKIKTK